MNFDNRPPKQSFGKKSNFPKQPSSSKYPSQKWQKPDYHKPQHVEPQHQWSKPDYHKPHVEPQHHWSNPLRPPYGHNQYVPVPIVISNPQPFPVYQPVSVQSYPQYPTYQASPYTTSSGCINNWATVRLSDGRTLYIFISSFSDYGLTGYLQNGQQITLNINQILEITC